MGAEYFLPQLEQFLVIHMRDCYISYPCFMYWIDVEVVIWRKGDVTYFHGPI